MTDRAGAFTQGLQTQLRVIYALLMREIITRYGRHNIGFLWLFVEPALFTLGVVALWSLFKGGTGGHGDIPVAAFAVTGYSTVLLWRNMSMRCVKAIEPNLSLLYHRQVKVIDVMMARCLLEIAGASGSFMALSCLLIFLDAAPMPHDLLMVLAGWGLMALFGMSLGFVVGALSERSEIIERVWHVFTYLLFPLSGAMFMVDWLPENMQKAILFFPMVHGTEMIRHGYYGNIVVTYESPIYLFVCSIILFLMGLALLRDVGRKVAPE